MQEPIQGNLIGMQQDSLQAGICIKICVIICRSRFTSQFLFGAYTQDEDWGDKSRSVTVQENTVKLQRSTSEDSASTSSAQHGVNDTLKDTDRKQHRGERSHSHHQNLVVCQDSKVASNNTEPATNKDWSNEDESTL